MAAKTTGNVSIDVGHDARIVIVADSHSRPHPRAYEWIGEQRPAAILHAGDIGRLSVLDELDSIAPTHSVRGNIDGHDPRTPDDCVVDLVADDQKVFRIFLTHIGVYGPRLRKDVAERAREHEAGLVICGHSHVPLIAEDKGLPVFNPGSLGPRRFQLPITFGVVELDEARVTLRHIDCETGETWLPPT